MDVQSNTSTIIDVSPTDRSDVGITRRRDLELEPMTDSPPLKKRKDSVTEINGSTPDASSPGDLPAGLPDGDDTVCPTANGSNGTPAASNDTVNDGPTPDWFGPSGKLHGARQPGIKVTVLFRKKDGITDEKFHKHWMGKHVDLALSVPTIASSMKRYVQYHVSAEEKKKAAELGLPQPIYDGAAEIWVESMEAWSAMMADPKYMEIMRPDENEFCKDVTPLFGFENLVIGQPN